MATARTSTGVLPYSLHWRRNTVQLELEPSGCALVLVQGEKTCTLLGDKAKEGRVCVGQLGGLLVGGPSASVEMAPSLLGPVYQPVRSGRV